VLLVGEGALKFALAQGFQKEDLLTEASRKAWLRWKQSLSEEDDWLLPPDERGDKSAAIRRQLRPTGTIHCAAIDAHGDIACTTSTSGLAYKIPGRVGDSPLIAAGLYVDNEIGSCGATGRGEEVIRNAGSFAAVELMRSGMSPREAGLEILRRIAKHAPRRLIRPDGIPAFNVMLYLLRKDGEHAGASLVGPGQYSVTDDRGTRWEPCASLFDRPAS
jgi:N4-(beta-N-acetylglucosaminyl)-L-asparaginase